MNYLTGSHGFVGSNLLNKLKGEVICIPHQEINTFELKNIEKVVFCSAYGNMSDHTNDDLIIKANLLDLISILNKCVKLKFKSFVYISTSSVKLPVQTMYSRTKRASEEVLMSYVEKYHLPITIIRPYTVCGKGDNEKHLIPVLIKAAINGTEVNLCEGTHDYIDVDDLTNGILNLSEHQAQGIYELGSGISTTNEKVLEIVEFVTGKNIKVNKVPQLRKYDNPNWVCKNFKARGWGWLPIKSLVQSVQEEYEYLKKSN